MEIRELVARLYAFKISAKLVHWKLYGPQFLELHEYMDDVAEPIDGFIDEILEKYYMATDIESLKTIEDVFKTESLKFYAEKFNNVENMIRSIINLADEIQDGIDEIDTYRGVNAILDEISAHMLKTRALLKAQLS